MELTELITAVRGGDVAAYGRLVEATQAMVYATVRGVLRDPEEARDVVQETYLRAFRRIGSLRDPEAFAGWLRRIGVTTAQDALRARRYAFIGSPDVPEVPVLDDAEEVWTQGLLGALAEALLTLSPDDRALCERHYHGGASLAELAHELRTTPAAMRKRMQRIRDRLREEIEMAEQRNIAGEPLPAGMPAKIVELLAKPRLLNLPDNPIARIWDVMKPYFPGFTEIELPEILEDEVVRRELNLPQTAIAYADITHRVDERRYLRSNLTEAMLMAGKSIKGAKRLMSAGKVYRKQEPTRTRVEMFHQGEFMLICPREEAWNFAGSVCGLVEGLFPNSAYRLTPVTFPHVCERAWEMEVTWQGAPCCILSWGFYEPAITRLLGYDPQRFVGVGAGLGLERIACLYYGIDDVRKVEAVSLPG